MDSAIILMIAFVGLFFIQLLFFVSRYIKCPPNKALVIYGRTAAEGNKALILFSGAEFVWPIIQDHAFLDLAPFNDKIQDEFTSKDLISVPAKISIDYGISTDEELIQKASARLLGKERIDIQNIAKGVILGAVKEVLSSNDLVTIATSKNNLHLGLVTQINETLNKLGIQLINFDISYLKNQDDQLKELEQKFKASKLANFEVLDKKEVQQQLDILNQQIETNTQERSALVQSKIELLAKLK